MPIDPDRYKPVQAHLDLGSEFYDLVEPAHFPEHIIRYRNQFAAGAIGLADLSDTEWVEHFAQFNTLPDNIPTPMALRYHGHQFRTYNPELGDGRGFLFAQVKDDKGRLLDLGTKGSGPTPWSRGGDGRLTLKGGVREVLATELLTALGVYTSKSLSLIETGEQLVRNDEPSPARSGVLVRLNHSHIRIGTFQRLLYLQKHDEIEKLVHYCLEHYYPNVEDSDYPVISFYKAVVRSVAKLGAEWFAAGFVHGVLNTDNITVTGESFDYGPWRFLPTLEPEFTAAYFDHNGLYAFGRQPDALHWNLARLAECLLPISNLEDLKSALADFSTIFESELQKQTFARLGIVASDLAADPLITQFYQTLRDSDAGYEQLFYDFMGGAVEGRLAASPQSERYQSAAMRTLIDVIRERDLVEECSQILSHSFVQEHHAATTLLIEDVEEIWAAISEHDDWSAFNAKINTIRDFGKLNAQLMEYGISRGY